MGFFAARCEGNDINQTVMMRRSQDTPTSVSISLHQLTRLDKKDWQINEYLNGDKSSERQCGGSRGQTFIMVSLLSINRLLI